MKKHVTVMLQSVGFSSYLVIAEINKQFNPKTLPVQADDGSYPDEGAWIKTWCRHLRVTTIVDFDTLTKTTHGRWQV